MAAPWTPQREAMLSQLWPKHTATEIAAQFGVSRNTVLGKVHRMGLAPKPRAAADPKTPVSAPPRKPISKRTAKPPKPAEPASEPARMPLLDLRFGQCRFPLPNGRFCAAPVIRDTSWCPNCARVVYRQ